MKRILVFLAVTALASTAAHGQSVDRKFDRFQNTTEFGVKKVTVSGGGFTGNDIDLTTFYVCEGDVPACLPKSVELLFSQSGDDWRYLDDHSFVLLLDGKNRVDVDPSGYDGRVGEGYVLEFQEVRLTPQQIRKVASATTVEAQWGTSEFKFSDKSLKAIRALAATLPAASQ